MYVGFLCLPKIIVANDIRYEENKWRPEYELVWSIAPPHCPIATQLYVTKDTMKGNK